MSKQEEPLFQPLKVGKIELKHRIAMAPMSRMRATGHQVQENLHPQYYDERSSSPGTLIISEAVLISDAADGYPDAAGIYKKEHVEGWTKIANVIHANKSFLFVQIAACGRAANKAFLDSKGVEYVGASNIPDTSVTPHGPVPRALTIPEIKQYTADFVQAAKNAIEAGADGIEIHAANGFLLDQFQHANTNNRTDQYGGSIENRSRFILELVDSLIETIGAERVAIRLSPWNIFNGMELGVSPIPQFSYVVAALQERALAGNELAYIHVVETRDDVLESDTDNDVPSHEEGGSNSFVREIWKGVIVGAGGFNLSRSKEATEKDDKLVIAIGRYFVSNPDIVVRWKKGIKLTPYNRSTFYTPGKVGYIDYPFAEEVKAGA